MKNLPRKVMSSEIILYQTDDGRTKIEVRLEDETAWLSQRLMADLFQVTVPTVNEHIRNICEEKELEPGSTIRKFRIVQIEGARQVSSMMLVAAMDTKENWRRGQLVRISYRFMGR